MNKKIQHLTQDSIEKYGDTKLGKAVQINNRAYIKCIFI